MQTFVAGQAVELFIDLPAPLPMGTGDLPYRVLDAGGQELGVGLAVPGQLAVTVGILIPADLNQITTAFGRRTVILTAPNSTVRTAYRLLPEILFTTTAAEVRSYLGVRETELADDDIDVVKAFLEIQAQVGREQFRMALVSGEDAELKANDAVLYRAALNVIPSLINRIAVAESDGQLSFQRNAQRDFRELVATTEAKLSTALNIVAPLNSISYALLLTTNDADPVTG